MLLICSFTVWFSSGCVQLLTTTPQSVGELTSDSPSTFCAWRTSHWRGGAPHARSFTAHPRCLIWRVLQETRSLRKVGTCRHVTAVTVATIINKFDIAADQQRPVERVRLSPPPAPPQHLFNLEKKMRFGFPFLGKEYILWTLVITNQGFQIINFLINLFRTFPAAPQMWNFFWSHEDVPSSWE